MVIYPGKCLKGLGHFKVDEWPFGTSTSKSFNYRSIWWFTHTHIYLMFSLSLQVAVWWFDNSTLPMGTWFWVNFLRSILPTLDDYCWISCQESQWNLSTILSKLSGKFVSVRNSEKCILLASIICLALVSSSSKALFNKLLMCDLFSLIFAIIFHSFSISIFRIEFFFETNILGNSTKWRACLKKKIILLFEPHYFDLAAFNQHDVMTFF